MAMAKKDPDRSVVAESFIQLKEFGRLIDEEYFQGKNTCLYSMGMSNDFQMAVEKGSDFVRIGSLLFN